MTFSILERIDVGETLCYTCVVSRKSHLSVSSNGSTWVKLRWIMARARRCWPFSILERIDVGETVVICGTWVALPSFSILERIDVGETGALAAAGARGVRPFSILERIDVGETTAAPTRSSA